MHRLLSRTSITIDEAVWMLLGRSSGPIEFHFDDDNEEMEANCPAFDLRETLEDELDMLAGEYEMAKAEKKSAEIVAEALAARQRQEAVLEQAIAYICEINDEINKGESALLKLDRALSNAAYTYVTLHSFNEWVKRRQSSAGERPAGVEATDANRVAEKKEKKPRDKGLRQDAAILAEIERLGFNPKNLPKNPPGKSDIKARVGKAIANRPLFPSYDRYEKRWQLLRGQGLIVEGVDPAPPKRS